MTVFINDLTGEISQLKLKRRLGRLLRELGRSGESITVMITDDRDMREMNKLFRGLDKSTNVLAFPDTDEAVGLKNYLGDVAVSLETVKREAPSLNRSAGEHFHFCAVHALLHLLGHDHELGPEEERLQHDETRRLMALIKHDL
jgi:probable rRNA maturation factor